jgi:hypothetical protein
MNIYVLVRGREREREREWETGLVLVIPCRVGKKKRDITAQTRRNSERILSGGQTEFGTRNLLNTIGTSLSTFYSRDETMHKRTS